MIPSTNVPYVKQYDENGNLLNQIEGSYPQKGMNRRKRRSLFKSIKNKHTVKLKK